jgi:glycosyltransferase involved in cell wall biosynthesis
MPKIKLFVDAHVFDTSYQGTTTYLKGLYNALVKDDAFEITLGAHNTEHLKTIFPDPRFRFIQLHTASKYKRLAFELPELIGRGGFDYAHFQYITPLFKKCRYINTIHDLLFMDFPDYFPFSYRFTKKYLFRFSAKKSDLICTVSDYSRQALVRHFGIDAGKIFITPNAVSAYTGHYQDVKEKYKIGKYILFVSRLEPRKNHLLMLKAFVELGLHEKGYHLVFIGRMDDVKTEAYHAYYNALPDQVKRFVINAENIFYEELNSFYKQADLFVYPSVAEGFGIPPLEAAANGCKVLCSNRTAMADFDFFGKYLFDPHNEEEFKQKILSTLSDEKYPFEEIRRVVLEKYNWDAIAGDFGNKLKTIF